jgi:hypothetical protein
MLTVRKCEAVPVTDTKPRMPIRIVQCGELWKEALLQGINKLESTQGKRNVLL